MTKPSLKALATVREYLQLLTSAPRNAVTPHTMSNMRDLGFNIEPSNFVLVSTAAKVRLEVKTGIASKLDRFFTRFRERENVPNNNPTAFLS